MNNGKKFMLYKVISDYTIKKLVYVFMEGGVLAQAKKDGQQF
jgi:hypothetical protein